MKNFIQMGTLALVIGSSAAVGAPSEFIDMTHAIPTFTPSSEDATKPDLHHPVGTSSLITGFYHQAVLYPIDNWPTNQGYFRSTAILLQEHNGTSFNAPNHYVNNLESTEAGAVAQDQRKSAEQLSSAQLTGDVVMIDISKRVAKELAKNGGEPHPDTNITDFSDQSMATIRAEDVRAVADQIKQGVWLVGNVGWDQFYFSGTEDWDQSRYTNALNHPGFTAEAIDELIRIMDEKQIKISGIAADSLSTDSGQGAKGSDDKWSDAWPAHVRLYQRDILIVENLANVDQLSAQPQGSCALMVGALKHIGGTGGPARVMAVCD